MKIRHVLLPLLSLLFAGVAGCSNASTQQEHDFHEVIEEAPTCTKAGRGYLECEFDGVRTKEMEIPALGHEMRVKIVAPTCEEEGYDVHYCARCGYEEPHDHFVEPLGHDFVTHEIPPTCEHQGYRESYCTRCGKDEYEPIYLQHLEHDFVFDHHVDPEQCGERGYDVMRCASCGETKKANYTETLPHDYVLSNKVNADCDHGGYEEYVCARCGESKRDNVVDHLDHDFAYEQTVDPTCGEMGYDVYRCIHCRKAENRNYTAPLGHHYEIETTEATCLEPMRQKKVCTRCSHIAEERDVGEALGHDYEHNVLVQPTCTEPATVKDICRRCGDVTEEHPFGEPLGHDLWTETHEATCLTPKTERDHCHRCDYVSEYREVGESLGHDYQIDVITDATCTEPEKIQDKCTRCGDCINERERHPALGHDWKDGTLNEATCTEPKQKRDVCARCGAISNVYTEGEPLGHDMHAAENRDPTCAQYGMENHEKCSRCGFETYDVITELQHVYEKIVVDPTCTQRGYTHYRCKFCSYHFDGDFVEPLGHDEVWHDAEAATCHKPGHKAYYTCSRCDYSTYQESVLPYSYDCFETIRTVEATTHSQGYTEMKCLNCGEIVHTDFVDVLRPSGMEKPETKTVKLRDDDNYYYFVSLGTLKHVPLHIDYAFRWSASMAKTKSHPKTRQEAMPTDVASTIQEKVSPYFEHIQKEILTKANMQGWGLTAWPGDAMPYRLTDGSLDDKAKRFFAAYAGESNASLWEVDDRNCESLAATINARPSLFDPAHVDQAQYEEGIYYYYASSANLTLYLMLRYDIANKALYFAPYTGVDLIGSSDELFARPGRDIDCPGEELKVLGNANYYFSKPTSYETNHPLKTATYTKSYGGGYEREYGDILSLLFTESYWRQYLDRGYNRCKMVAKVHWKGKKMGVWTTVLGFLNDQKKYFTGGDNNNHEFTHSFALSEIAGKSFAIKLDNSDTAGNIFGSRSIWIYDCEVKLYFYSTKAAAEGVYDNVAEMKGER